MLFSVVDEYTFAASVSFTAAGLTQNELHVLVFFTMSEMSSTATLSVCEFELSGTEE